MTEQEIKQKALSCKYFYITPLATALICKRTGNELKSMLHGIEWDGKECEQCEKFKKRKKKDLEFMNKHFKVD